MLGPRFHSSRSPVRLGVPQGSILCPSVVIQNRLALFADDSKCSSVIESLQDCESLQKDLDSLHGWSDNWHLKFNTSKCEVLTVTRKRHPFRYDYKLNNNSLKHVTQVKDLGVTISPDLTCRDTHINTILAKANRMLAFLCRNSVMSFTTDHRKLLYLTFVRSYIGYAREVWAPSISKNTGTGEMSYDTYGIFYIPVNFAFNLPNYVASYMHYSGKKKKNRNLKVTKNLLPGDSNPDPPIS